MDNTIRRQYERTDSECPICEEGRLWANTFELYCDNCDSVLRSEDSKKGFEKYGEEIFRHRTEHTYHGSERVILFGGFPSAYQGKGLYG